MPTLLEIPLRQSLRLVLLPLLAPGLAALTGCEKIQEMTAKDDVASTPSAPPPGASLPGTGSPPPSAPPSAPAAPKSPKQILDDFLAKQPRLITNQDLEELANLPEGQDQITLLNLSDSRVGDSGLAHVGMFPNVETLNLSGTMVSNGGLAAIADLPKLKTLALDRTQNIDETGLSPLAKCPALKEVSVQSTMVADGIFPHLKEAEGLEVLRVGDCSNLHGREFSAIVQKNGFKNLKELYAGNSPFVYYGLLELNRLKQLEVLDASHPTMNDGFIGNFQNCTKLRKLSLSNSAVSNEGLKMMSKFRQLEELHVNGCKGINDAGLMFLKTHKQLKKLDLDGTSCTAAAVQGLKKQLPNTTIRFTGQDL